MRPSCSRTRGREVFRQRQDAAFRPTRQYRAVFDRGRAPDLDYPMGQIRVGIGGWVYAPWRGTFYPKGLPQAQELAHASHKLTTIEINGTFYGTQKPESFRRWAAETPADFVFSLKGPRFAT